LNLHLLRYSDNTLSTLGLLFWERMEGYVLKLEFFCYLLEDEFRVKKVMHETRIPQGRYQLKILKQETPLTLKHRKSHGDWFRFHLEVTDVPGFTGIYIHAGNTDKDTSGCLLPGFGCKTMNGVQMVTDSRAATKALYDKLYPYLDKGGRSWITIKDESYLLDNLNRSLTEDKLI